jgi:regulatory protein
MPTKPPAINLRQRALDYLAKREYSEQELAQKLGRLAQQHELDIEQIPAILADFKQRNWLSDTRFTAQIVHARQAKFGSARVANELREKGVDDTLIADAVLAVKANELGNATEVWRKKYKAAPNTREEWAKQARFLQSRGFGFDVIKQVLKTITQANTTEEFE